jgi:hypothetical protein
MVKLVTSTSASLVARILTVLSTFDKPGIANALSINLNRVSSMNEKEFSELWKAVIVSLPIEDLRHLYRKYVDPTYKIP